MNTKKFIVRSLFLLVAIAASSVPSFADSYTITFNPATNVLPAPVGTLDYDPVTQTFGDISVTWEGLTWSHFAPLVGPVPSAPFAPGTTGQYFAATLFDFFEFVSDSDGSFIVSTANTGVPPISGFNQNGTYSISSTPTPEPGSLCILFFGLLALGLVTGMNRLGRSSRARAV